MKMDLYGLLISLLMVVSFNALATADGPDYWQVHSVDSNDVLNIRSEPHWQSRKIGEIPPDGQCIKNLKCVGGLTFHEFTTLSEAEKQRITKERPRWCYIEYKGIKGWVTGRYLIEGPCGKSAN
jgi:uncharacterized protein YgiM (DUF1202 family)